MKPVTAGPSPEVPLGRGRLVRNAAIVACALALAGGIALLALKPKGEFLGDNGDYLVMLAAWGLLALVYAWNRYRPRAPYGAASRPKTEAFQAKRWRLLLLCVGYLALLVVPISVSQGLRPDPAATPVKHIFFCVLFLAPCALVVGLMTSAIYSKAWGAAVDDELTLANRAGAFRWGFMTLLGAGGLAYVAALFHPDWALALLPAVMGLGVAAAGLRFALLERAAAQDG